MRNIHCSVLSKKYCTIVLPYLTVADLLKWCSGQRPSQTPGPKWTYRPLLSCWAVSLRGRVHFRTHLTRHRDPLGQFSQMIQINSLLLFMQYLLSDVGTGVILKLLGTTKHDPVFTRFRFGLWENLVKLCNILARRNIGIWTQRLRMIMT